MPLARHETVPNSTHTELTRVTDTAFGEERYHFLRSAILEPIEPTDPPGQPAPNDRRPVVFILHGIRAGKRGWVKGLKEILESRTERPVAITPSYGYFSALSFALRYRRVSNLRWFLDRYSQELVRRPDTTFCFAGHSNGTYILGSALAAVPSLAFNNVYLAGSVLPRRYDWASRFSGQQLTALRNDCASRDIPVLWLCSALKSLRQTDVGTAGVDGFDDLDERAVEYSYLEGGHAAALDDGRLPAIASFVMTGTSSAPGGLVPSPSRAFAFVGRLLQVVTLLAFVAGAYVVGRWIASGPVVAHALVTAGVAFVAWILLRAA
jgi:hypothetical protein